MNCKSATDLLFEYIDGALPASEKAELEDHLAGCSDCRKELESRRETLTLIAKSSALREGAIYSAVMDRIEKENIRPDGLSDKIIVPGITRRPIGPATLKEDEEPSGSKLMCAFTGTAGAGRPFSIKKLVLPLGTVAAAALVVVTVFAYREPLMRSLALTGEAYDSATSDETAAGAEMADEAYMDDTGAPMLFAYSGGGEFDTTTAPAAAETESAAPTRSSPALKAPVPTKNETSVTAPETKSAASTTAPDTAAGLKSLMRSPATTAPTSGSSTGGPETTSDSGVLGSIGNDDAPANPTFRTSLRSAPLTEYFPDEADEISELFTVTVTADKFAELEGAETISESDGDMKIMLLPASDDNRTRIKDLYPEAQISKTGVQNKSYFAIIVYITQ